MITDRRGPNELQRDVAEVLTDFARTLADRRNVSAVFDALVAYTTDLLGVDGVGVLLLGEDGSLAVATASNSMAGQIEQLEAELAEGPCTDSIRSGTYTLVPNLEAAVDEYPNFAPRAIAAGAFGIYGLPMGARLDHVIGAVDIITTKPIELSDEVLRTADMLAEVAVSYLVAIKAHEDASRLAVQLQGALDSRVFIEQAKGVLAGRHGIPLDDAFELMRRHARQHGQRLQDVSRLIRDGELDLI